MAAGAEWTGAEVYLRKGPGGTDVIYYRSESFVLQPEDSGTADHPVVYSAYPGDEGQVRIVGGVKLEWDNFVEVADQEILDRLDPSVRGLVYKINLFENGISVDDLGELKRRGVDNYWGGKRDPSTGLLYPPPGPLEIFVDQEPMQLARWPDKQPDHNDLLQTPQVDPPDTAEEDKVKGTKFQFANQVDPDRPINRWETAPDPWFQGFFKASYIDSQVPGTLNLSEKTIELVGIENFTIGEKFYFAKNLLEEITKEGEWYLDRASGILYILPVENIAEKEIMVSKIGDSLLVLKGVSNVQIVDITFEMGRGELVSVHEDYAAGADATDNQFYGCVFRNAYYAGITVFGIRNTLDRCKIYNTGDMGAYLVGGDEVTLTRGDNEIRNSEIYKVSRWRMGWVPGIRIKGVGQTIRHNALYNMPAQAISGGTQENIIEYNDISNLLHYGSDIAAIYLGGGWHKRGNKIRHNHIHDITVTMWPEVFYSHGDGDKGGHHLFGLYLDDAHSGAEVYSNVFNDIAGAGLFHGGGRDNYMNNNIMVRCQAAFWTDNRGMQRIQHPKHDGDAYDHFERLKMGTGDFVHTSPPWSSAYPKLAGMGEDWVAIWSSDGRQPQGCYFTRNAGYGNDHEIVFFQNNERRNPADTLTLDLPLRGVTYPLEYFVDWQTDNNLSTTPFCLQPENGIISIQGLDDIPIGRIGVDY